MLAVAIKKGSREKTLDFQEMGDSPVWRLRWEILHRTQPTIGREAGCRKAGTVLEKVLAEEHERDRKHSDRIELPQ